MQKRNCRTLSDFFLEFRDTFYGGALRKSPQNVSHLCDNLLPAFQYKIEIILNWKDIISSTYNYSALWLRHFYLRQDNLPLTIFTTGSNLGRDMVILFK